MRKINRAVKIRIYPNKEQITQIEKTIGCSRFLYNRMLADKIRHYQEEKKMLKIRRPDIKRISMAERGRFSCAGECTVKSGRGFPEIFREPGVGFPHYKSKKHSRKSYTTNMVNGNICLQDRFLKLPKMQPVKNKTPPYDPGGWKLKSVTVSREPSGKYFASLLFDCENQTAEKDRRKNSWGWILPCMGCVYFLPVKEPDIPCFTGMQRKRLAREQRKLSRCEKGSRNYQKQKKKVALYHEKIKKPEEGFPA